MCSEDGSAEPATGIPRGEGVPCCRASFDAVRHLPFGGSTHYARAMGLAATGRIYAIFDAKQITERFRKREFVLEMGDNPQYPQYVLFQLTGDRCEALDGFAKGDEVRIDFSLRGREWTSPKNEIRYFNSLDVWTLDKLGSESSAGPSDFEPPPPDTSEPPF